MGHPLSWFKLCRISNFLTGVHFSTSKWPKKNLNLICKPLPGFKIIQLSPIWWGISVKRTISENGFDYFEVKWSLMYKFLIFLFIWILDYSKVLNKSTCMLIHFELFAPPWLHLFHPDGLIILDISTCLLISFLLVYHFQQIVRDCHCHHTYES